MQSLDVMRHGASHIMAAAVCRLFPGTKLDIGPATDDGFYYDFDLEHRLTPEDFPKIEAEMERIVAANLPFERFEVSRAEAQKRYRAPLTTEIVPLVKFWPAEDYHQDYFRKNPNAGYCRVVIAPKIHKLEQQLGAEKQ